MEGSLQVAIIRGGIKELFIFLLSVKMGEGGSCPIQKIPIRNN